jgi:REP element-mobilizing transposase RayT
MANTFIQLYVHIIYSTKGREKIFPKKHKDEIQKYITGIIQKRGHKLIVINNMPDHIHIFIGLNPSQAISDLVRDIKQNSTKFIKKNRMLIGSFAWQEGYEAFSYFHSQIDEVVKYIQGVEYCKFALKVYLYLIHQYIFDIFNHKVLYSTSKK